MKKSADKKTYQIDRQQIPMPKIRISRMAFEQIFLIKSMEFAQTNEQFRIQVNGKECDGFTYTCGFTPPDHEDFSLTIKGPEQRKIQILLDPFIAFYFRDGQLDYIEDKRFNQFGFVVTNNFQDEFHGKFWKDKNHLIPPAKKTQDVSV
jgi:Fe-S cluster assembly iron-binding protein IscA